jgi:hypothetical protein
MKTDAWEMALLMFVKGVKCEGTVTNTTSPLQ